METNTTKVNQMHAAVELLKAVAETIREVKEAPSGTIYAVLMTVGVSHATYVACVDTLKRAKLVKESNHLLTWIGPKN